MPWETSRSKVPANEQDSTWAALVETASRLDARLEDNELEVLPLRRRTRHVERDGLFVGNDWIDVFEPVRERQRGGNWTEVQTVDHAAEEIAAFLRERADRAD